MIKSILYNIWLYIFCIPIGLVATFIIVPIVFIIYGIVMLFIVLPCSLLISIICKRIVINIDEETVKRYLAEKKD